MSLHLFRPNEPAQVLTPPVGTCRGKRGLDRARQLLTQLAGLYRRHGHRQALCILLLAVAVVSQLVLLLAVGYMVDLCISLMELWAELARKHLEITL